jgi:DNA mismatch repair protein MutL
MTNWTSNPVTQHLLTYIICPEGSDLLIIDQHAAHERIMYEKIKNRTVTGTQDLLVAQTIELEPAVAALISGHLDELKELGFNIENFGKNSIIVRGVPVVLTAKNIDEAVKETLSELSDSFRIKSVEERRESMWKMMACKAAVKAGDKLSMAEMEGLVEELKATSNPTTCPHGRPTMVRISKEQMEKMFGR